MQKVRNHLVNFRVTEEELEQLKSACDRQGARCLSHFVRNAVLSSPDLDAGGVSAQVLMLDRRVTALETRFQPDSPSSEQKEVPPCV